ncbi:MAG: hypothetical protein WA902_14920 [Thermosynechococcaceae cyanobacterium]
MDTKELLLQEIESAPSSILEAALDFVRLLKDQPTPQHLEDQADIAAARVAITEAQAQGTTSLQDLKQELGFQ